MNLKTLITSTVAILLAIPAFGNPLPFPADKYLPWEGAGAFVWCESSSAVDNLLGNFQEEQRKYGQTGVFSVEGCVLTTGIHFRFEPKAEYYFISDTGEGYGVFSYTINGSTLWTYQHETVLEEKPTF